MNNNALMLMSSLFTIAPIYGDFKTQIFNSTKKTRRLEVSTERITGWFPEECAVVCFPDRSCDAFAFSEKSQQCELYRVSDLTTSKKLVSDPDWDYFEKTRGKDCADLFNNGMTQSDVYIIKPHDVNDSVQVYCDMETDGGGWTVFQRRQDGSVDFYRDWNDYKTGFGILDGEFWLGNDNIHQLSNQDSYELRIDLEDGDGIQVYATYDSFSITSEATQYKLRLGNYSGNAGDSLTYSHKDQSFSTYDRDNDMLSDKSCAVKAGGAWWYKRCLMSNLNGPYLNGPHKTKGVGVNWSKFRGNKYSLKNTSMKIRPVGFKSSK